MKDFDFRGVWFPDKLLFEKFEFRTKADFRSATFSAEANFRDATFNAEAYFRDATFSAKASFHSTAFSAKADFSSATFSAKASFSLATFSAKASFSLATFSAEADFRSATFSAEVYFSSAAFTAEAYFRSVTFADHVRFEGAEKHQVFIETSRLDLQFARIEKPDRVSFHTLSLRPHWFVNIDARKFDFTNVNWGRLSINQEISRLGKNRISSPHHLLAIACRNLAVNAEENHRYEEASRFRYMAMEARRLESWRGFVPWKLSWWYWLASGYGERVLRALVVFVGIVFIFALLYRSPLPRCPKGSPNPNSVACIVWDQDTSNGNRFDSFSFSVMYALEVMTLQKPEPRPKSPLAHLVVTLCTILAPCRLPYSHSPSAANLCVNVAYLS